MKMGRTMVAGSRVQAPEREERAEAAPRLCLVPKDVPPDVVAALDQHFAADNVSVRVVRGRRHERRAGADRRDESVVSPQTMERRFAPDLEGRRFWERRGDYVQVEAPLLPAAAQDYRDKLRFVCRRPRAVDEQDLGRLRGLVEDWRTRARDHEREATGLLQSLVGVVEDLRALRTLTPRWFLAVRRGERAIDLHRRRHLTR
jgi:hypothetical protein